MFSASSRCSLGQSALAFGEDQYIDREHPRGQPDPRMVTTTPRSSTKIARIRPLIDADYRGHTRVPIPGSNGPALRGKVTAGFYVGGNGTIPRPTDSADVLAAFIGAVRSSPRPRAKRELGAGQGLRSVADAQFGAVTFVQGADSSLRLNVHFRCVVLDGSTSAKPTASCAARPPLAQDTRPMAIG